ncbi:MAG: hypothetical protein KF743_01445 [Fimbriimonadaceae bacterium]|nr:hypothetical protein [Fimbriimonadaceae bacterium]
MALKKVYKTVNGQLRGEKRSGESHSRDYVSDGLGKIVGVYQNGWLCADGCYSPYGGLYSGWAINSDGYKFTWLGAWGYRQTGRTWPKVYVRARHYAPLSGSWTTVDPLWTSEPAYRYVGGRAMGAVDPSGMALPIPIEPILPPGWSVGTGGGGIKPSPGGSWLGPFGGFDPLPPGFPSPHGDPEGYNRECWKENERRKDKDCLERYDIYKNGFCGGSRADQPNSPQKCKDTDAGFVLLVKLIAWCGCCDARNDFNDHCLGWLKNLNSRMTHLDEANKACAKCNECLRIAQLGSKKTQGPLQNRPPVHQGKPGPTLINPVPYI